MPEKSFGLLFYLKKPRKYQEGNVPVYLRITVDGVSKEVSTRRTCEPERWSSEAQRVKGTKMEQKSLNAYLDMLERKVYEAQVYMFEHMVPLQCDKHPAIERGGKQEFDIFTYIIFFLVGFDGDVTLIVHLE